MGNNNGTTFKGPLYTSYFIGATSSTITANPGGGQANAVQLTSEVNVVTTVATSGDSVQLPPGQAGLDVAVINTTSQPMAVYGNGTDTIGSESYITQMPYSVVLYICSSNQPGATWYTDGLGMGYSTQTSIPTVSVIDSVTAIGTSKTTAYQIINSTTRVTTNSGTPAGVTLPLAFPGYSGVTVINATSTALLIYAAGSDDISVSAAAASTYSLAANKTIAFYSTVAGHWHGALSA